MIINTMKMYRLTSDFSYKSYDDDPFVSFIRKTGDPSYYTEIIAMIPDKVNYFDVVIGDREEVTTYGEKKMIARKIDVNWKENIEPLTGKQDVWLIQLKYTIDETGDDDAVWVKYNHDSDDIITETSRGTVTTSSDPEGKYLGK